jgi:ketosteroid isomerase-like protein
MPNTDARSRADIIRAVFAAGDSADIDKLCGFLTDDVELVFGNAAPLKGREAVGTTNREFYRTIRGVRHEIHNLWHAAEDADVLLAQMTVHYTRLDGSVISLPCFNCFRMCGDLISDYRIYMDVNPVFA